jgi:single-strand DNA-binding protein
LLLPPLGHVVCARHQKSRLRRLARQLNHFNRKNMNSITLTGNLGKDAELRHLQDGTAVCSFSVADSMGRDKPSIWWNCSMFGKRAESLQQYLIKGQQVTVVGTVTEREFTDKTGAQRKSMDVRVSDLALQGGKRDGAAPAPVPRPAAARAPAPRPDPASHNFDEMDSDIPF